MSGYELAAKLRAGGFCPPLMKLVAVMGYAKDPEALAAAGFDGDRRSQLMSSDWAKRLANLIATRRELPRP